MLHRSLAGLLVALALGAGSAVTVLAAPALPGSRAEMVAIADDSVTVRAAGTPLRQLIAELGRQGGAEVRWLSPGGDEPVSAHFAGLSTADAVRRLAPGHSFTLLYRGTRLRAIWIAAAPRVAAARTATDGAASERPSSDPAEAETERPAEQIARVERLALDSPNVAQRADATKWLVAASSDDGEARAALERLMADSADPATRALAAETLREIP